ncbi:MAG: hypothetical protein RIQ52_1527 [Pseudomonadota bacterium]
MCHRRNLIIDGVRHCRDNHATTYLLMRGNDMAMFSLPGPHDVPFAAPLMAGAFIAFTVGFIILKLLDRIIDQPDS